MTNENLNRAKKTKNDEYYTTKEGAARMVSAFGNKLAGMRVFSNCDGFSAVSSYIGGHIMEYGIEKYVSIGRKLPKLPNGNLAAIEYDSDGKKSFVDCGPDYDGDFRSEYAKERLKECDVLISNPPFSRDDGHAQNKFVEFVVQALDLGKEIVAVGPMTGVSYKALKKHIVSGRLRAFKTPFKNFITPDGKTAYIKVALFTTFDHDPFSDEMKLAKTDASKLPFDSNLGVRVNINGKGLFSELDVPDIKPGEKIILPTSIVRKKWYRHFDLLDVVNVVKPVGMKEKLPGLLMRRK